jgi:hypothetical protein
MERDKLLRILSYFRIYKYRINDDGSIDCYQNVDLSYSNLKKIPIQFKSVYGSFDCSGNILTSLKGVPSFVAYNFDCSDNDITDLSFAPEYVGNNFINFDNNIPNFCYTKIGKFYCSSYKEDGLNFDWYDGIVSNYNEWQLLQIRKKRIKNILKT